MSNIDMFSVIIEYLYYFSGIFVGIGVIFAVIQYQLIKKDTITKYNREIVSWTSELLRSFYKEILPKYEQLCIVLEKNIFYLPNELIKIDIKNSNIITSCKNYIENISIYNKLDAMKDLAISLQILAVGLSYGNADIDMAKNVISKKYIKILETVLPSIITDSNIELFNECIELYNNWNYDMKKIEHERQGESLKFASKELAIINKNIIN